MKRVNCVDCKVLQWEPTVEQRFYVDAFGTQDITYICERLGTHPFAEQNLVFPCRLCKANVCSACYATTSPQKMHCASCLKDTRGIITLMLAFKLPRDIWKYIYRQLKPYKVYQHGRLFGYL